MSAGMGKGIKYSQDQSSIMLLFEHNFRHNAVNYFDGYDQKQNAQIFGHNVSNPIAGASLIFVHFFHRFSRSEVCAAVMLKLSNCFSSASTLKRVLIISEGVQ